MRSSPVLTWLRELAATVGSFDRSAIELGYALRCTVGVAVPLAIAAMLGRPALGVAPAIGAFITGFTSLQGIYRTRLSAILIAALGMSATSFVGATAAHSTPGIIAATAAAAYACATIGQIGPIASTVALNSFVAFILFSSQALPPSAALQQSILVLGGGLVQAALLLIPWPTEGLRAERAALSDVYRNLAAYAREIAAGLPALPPVTPFATARQVIADPQPFASAGQMARVERLLEDSEVIRRRLGAVAAELQSHPEGFAGAGVAEGAAQQLDAIANVLQGSKIAPPEPPTPGESPEIAGAHDLAAHLRDAGLAASLLSSGRFPHVGLLSQPRPGPYIRNHVDWFSRESLRFAVVSALAMVLGRHFAAERGYWIPLTAALVLKPDFETTFVRGVARIAGTLVGAIVASLALLLVRGHGTLQLVGIGVSAAAAYLTFNPNYALFTVAITSFVVMVLAMRGLSGTTTIDARILDTLAGGALAMLGYLVMPTWERKRTRALLADLIDAQRNLADAILQAYSDPTSEARAAIDRARTKAWKVRTAVEGSIDRARREPYRPHTIGAGRALRVLSAMQRFGLANLGLDALLETQPPREAPDALPAFAQALDDRMAQLAHALRESHRARPDTELTEASARLESQLDPASAEHRFLLDRVAAYVDAAARLERLIGIEKGRAPRL